MTHTKGKWFVDWDSLEIKQVGITNEKVGKTICGLATYPPFEGAEDKESQTNAKLIASAPELLEACKSVNACIGKDCKPLGVGGMEGIKDILQQAINKAEGK